jgi:polyhydroxyalkanoate synthase
MSGTKHENENQAVSARPLNARTAEPKTSKPETKPRRSKPSKKAASKAGTPADASAEAAFAAEAKGADEMKDLATLADRMNDVTSAFWRRLLENKGFSVPDPGVIAGAFAKAMVGFLTDPADLVKRQAELMQGYAKLWESAARRFNNEPAEPAQDPAPDDRRFHDKAWTEPYFDFLKQAYLLNARWLQETLPASPGLDPKTKRKVEFYTRQLVDALAPTNFAATNPQVLRLALESKGESLRKGLENLLHDLERGQGRLAISMTDYEAFKVGENLAITPGKVVFQNRMFQLLQYRPATETVYRRPLLIVPPWINKFYILDLKPANSFIRWAVGEGHSVFVISWVNPDESHADVDFEDYIRDGVLKALDAVEEATSEREINTIGYCIGGTLLAASLSLLAARNDRRVPSATFFASLVDFREPGELAVFIDEEQIALLKRHMEERGYLEAHFMATVFNLLRDRDLIWSFVVNNYLLGREPMAFDLLYWNSDATRMPAKMHQFYLRNMYLENRLIAPGGLEMLGVPIDLRKITIPVYQLSTKEDHIAPWQSTYAASQLYRGPYTFVLSGSGHIAGVINPPPSKKYGYWTNAENPTNPDDWLAGASQHEGSWWPHWAEWVKPFAGDRVPAREPGSGPLKALEDAPGSYVKVRV